MKRARHPYWTIIFLVLGPWSGSAQTGSNSLAVGLDFGALIDPATPSIAVSGMFSTDLGLSADLTLGLPGPYLGRRQRSRPNWTDRWHRELTFGVDYQVPPFQWIFRRVRFLNVRGELFHLRQSYTASDASFSFGSPARILDFDRARVLRTVQAVRVGTGSRVFFGERWILDYHLLFGIRRTTINYSQLEGTRTGTGAGSSGFFLLIFDRDDNSREGTEILPDMAFRVRLLYTLKEW